MLRRIPVSIPILLFILIIMIPLSVSADLEPNDTFATAELASEGSHSGLVDDDTEPADVDYYKVEVPDGYDLKVTLKNTDAGSFSEIHLDLYDEGWDEVTGLNAINLDAESGEKESDEWSNPRNGRATVYLKVYGDGFYTMKIEFEEAGAVGLTLALCIIVILIPIVIIVTVIVLVLLAKKRKEKEKTEQQMFQDQSQMQSQRRKKYQKPISEYTVELDETDFKRRR